MDRVFLDANVLFSAAYRESNGLLRLWQLPNVELVTSANAVNEAVRNLSDDEQLNRLTRLLADTRIVEEPDRSLLPPEEVSLPDKDIPILLAATQARASHLLTGDKKHFGSLFGKSVSDLRVETPAAYLATILSSDP